VLRVSVHLPEQRFQWWDTNRGQIGELYYERLSSIEVFSSCKTRYPDCCINAIEMCCTKNGYHKKWTCLRDVVITISLWKYIFRMGELNIWHYLTIITQRTNPAGCTRYKVGYYQCRLCSRTFRVISFDVVLTVVDSVSKKAYFILTHTTVTVKETMRLFLHHM